MSEREAVRALLSAGRVHDAVERVRAQWVARPTLANAARVLEVLGDGDPDGHPDGDPDAAPAAAAVPVIVRLRLAIERNWTVEPLVPLLRAQARWLGIGLAVRVGDYDQSHQALRAANGPLAAFRPDLLLVTLRDHLHAADRIGSVRAFRAGSHAPVLLDDEPPGHDEDAAAAARRHEHNRALAAGIAGLPSVHLMPHGACLDDAGWRAARDPRADAHHGLPWRSDAHAAIVAHWLRWIAPLAGRQAKLVVTDLDETLWPGVLDEGELPPLDGPAAAGHLRYQRELLALRGRGLLLAVASRNDRARALAALASHPGLLLRPEHFAATAIDWTDKAAGIASMADALGVGLDAVVFVDDSPIECERVRRALPAVHVIEPGGDAEARAVRLRDCPLVQRPVVTAEDLARADRYREAQARAAFLCAGEALLASLGLRVEALPAREAAARVAQLTVRTNQFNLTGLRLDEAALAALLDREGVHLAFTAADRFGDYGIVGAFLGVREGDRLLTEVMVLSCRALGRGVESRMLEDVERAARALGCRAVEGRYRPSGRNAGVADLFPRHGYGPLDTPDAPDAPGAPGADTARPRRWLRMLDAADRGVAR